MWRSVCCGDDDDADDADDADEHDDVRITFPIHCSHCVCGSDLINSIAFSLFSY